MIANFLYQSSLVYVGTRVCMDLDVQYIIETYAADFVYSDFNYKACSNDSY